METIYCTLNAKRLTFLGAAGRKASGGETVCYAVAPRPRAVPRPSGKVISLDDYRRSMDGIYSESVSEQTKDESPMVYKPKDEIMANIRDTVTVVNVITPVYNFKAAE